VENVAYKSEAMPPAKKRVAQQVSKANVVDVVVAGSHGRELRPPLARKPPDPGPWLLSSFTCG